MSGYSTVQDALARGADPAMLCGTCPWDRYCVTPPAMTKADIDAQIAKGEELDRQNAARLEAEGKKASMPVGTLVTALIYAGQDTKGEMCPVFALRLRSSGGRAIADTLKATMQKWDDQS